MTVYYNAATSIYMLEFTSVSPVRMGYSERPWGRGGRAMYEVRGNGGLFVLTSICLSLWVFVYLPGC